MPICTGLHKEQVLTEGGEILHLLPRKQDSIVVFTAFGGSYCRARAAKPRRSRPQATVSRWAECSQTRGETLADRGAVPRTWGQSCTLCPRTLSGMQPSHRGPPHSTAPGMDSHHSQGDGCPMATPGTRAGDAAEPQTHHKHLCCLAGGLGTRDLPAAALRQRPSLHTSYSKK